MSDLTDAEREASPSAARCNCGHRVRWHHDERGCGFHGFGPHRCDCVLSTDEVVTVQLAEQRERIAQAIEASAPTPGDAYTREPLAHTRNALLSAARIARGDAR